MTPPRNERVRFRFDKFGPVRFTSHRDIARIWERSLRRTRLPVAYSEGFSPRPKLSFGLALATSHESCGEYLDVDFPPGTVIDLSEVADLLGPTLPPGMNVQAAVAVDPGTPSLQEGVDHCTWLVEVPDLGADRALELIESVLSATELPVTRERKGKEVTDDIRPAVLSLRLAEVDELPSAALWRPMGALLCADLATHPRTCRPAELLIALDPALEEGRVIRLHQWTTVDGTRYEPVPVQARSGSGTAAAPSTLHATARAS